MPLPTVTPEPVPYTNHMARQFNGDVIQSILKAAHEQFNTYGNALVAHRSAFSLDTATTEELNLLGLALNVPRPYAVVDDVSVPADDPTYVRFFKNVMALRNSQSYLSLADVFYQFIPSGAFDLQINEQTGDIRIVMDDRFSQYKPFLEQAVNSVYTASPRLTPIETRDYFTYIWDHLLYLRFINLAQPNEWTFTFDAKEKTIALVSNNTANAIIDVKNGAEYPESSVLVTQAPNNALLAAIANKRPAQTLRSKSEALCIDHKLFIDVLYATPTADGANKAPVRPNGKPYNIACFTPPNVAGANPNQKNYLPVWKRQRSGAQIYTVPEFDNGLNLLVGFDEETDALTKTLCFSDRTTDNGAYFVDPATGDVPSSASPYYVKVPLNAIKFAQDVTTPQTVQIRLKDIKARFALTVTQTA